ncbi:MAG TPA: MalY/PatB family protein [Spirochaetota bacterium]|nr:MalY/PatB family protein [Spirochaetota bacterium]HPI90480.1 MalY/PatB family protein [Spirochaetota bacterium]HPR46924.1 MalY/PatB family protein [Spirochaetota bacterium]
MKKAVDPSLFDRDIAREGTASVKWDLRGQLFGRPDALPLWVADMDFPSPEPVISALEKRAAQGVYGYTFAPDEYYRAVTGWQKGRHGWDVLREWIHFSPGVVPGINFLIQAFTEPGQGVLLQLPVYYPFLKAVTSNGRVIVNSPLAESGGSYAIDYADFEAKAALPETRVFVLCNPHNPVGRVWTKEELVRMGEICQRHGVLVVADEIHSDIVYPGFTHVPFASLGESYALNSVTCSAPSKTFNLAGLQTSYLIIPDGAKGRVYRKKLESLGIMGPNLFGIEALIAAYTGGASWLEALKAYLLGNINIMDEMFGASGSPVTLIRPQGTYLAWLDFRKLGMDDRGLREFIINRAGLALDDGYIFGRDEGSGFQRLNFACTRKTLNAALVSLENALKQ